MRAPACFIAGALVLVAACAGPDPAVTSPASPTLPPAPSEQAVRELALGQTFGTYYDPAIERVVLVNGAEVGGPPRPTELWAWDGDAWELIDDTGPEARNYGAVAYDPDRRVLVMHGGLSSSGVPFDETLEWDGATWTQGTPPGPKPGPREGPGLAWDTISRRMLLFGGASNGELKGDTWVWSGLAWRQVSDAGPRARFVNLMTSDRSVDGGVLLQGGHWVDGEGGGNLDDTWHWDGTAWTELDGAGPGTRVNAPGAWDERLGGIAMFAGGEGETDGTGTNDTWLWTRADGWTEVEAPSAPGQRNAPGLAFDSKRQVLVLVGGIERAGGTQRLDVWELDAEGWHEVMPPT